MATSVNLTHGNLFLNGADIWFIVEQYDGSAGRKPLWIGCNNANPNAPFLMASYAAAGKAFHVKMQDPAYDQGSERYQAEYIGVTFLGFKGTNATGD